MHYVILTQRFGEKSLNFILKSAMFVFVYMTDQLHVGTKDVAYCDHCAWFFWHKPRGDPFSGWIGPLMECCQSESSRLIHSLTDMRAEILRTNHALSLYREGERDDTNDQKGVYLDSWCTVDFFLDFCFASKACRGKIISRKNDILREFIKNCSSKVSLLLAPD